MFEILHSGELYLPLDPAILAELLAAAEEIGNG